MDDVVLNKCNKFVTLCNKGVCDVLNIHWTYLNIGFVAKYVNRVAEYVDFVFNPYVSCQHTYML